VLAIAFGTGSSLPPAIQPAPDSKVLALGTEGALLSSMVTIISLVTGEESELDFTTIEEQQEQPQLEWLDSYLLQLALQEAK
jgi:hypothetical protein